VTTPYRRAVRPADRRLVGGVATGLAEHLGVRVLWIRIAFVAATWLHGAGVIAYLLLWRFLPLQEPELSPGLESASRRGLRSASRRPGILEVVQTVAVVAIGVGVLLLIQVGGRGVRPSLLVPVVLALLGVAVIWRQLDDASWGRWMRGNAGWQGASRIAVGGVLVVIAGVYILSTERGWGALADLAAATAIALVGLALILGPWIWKLWTDLSAERRERVRSQERADVAAHLHDSVLQTLALLQKNAADPAAVATLARRQERELRDWLYGDEGVVGESLLADLRAAASEVETAHHVRVDVVGVGDASIDPDTSALVKAAREAMVNAAKHAGVDRVDVYAEVGEREAEVFVRDRGAGFDPAAVADDRMGVRGSIVGRVERHGGSVDIKSSSDDGTEVRMTMPLRIPGSVPTTQESS